MRFVTYLDTDGRPALAVRRGNDLVTIDANEKGDNYSLLNLLQAGPEALKNAYAFSSRGKLLDEDNLTFLPPIPRPTKIICVGLNSLDLIKETLTSFDIEYDDDETYMIDELDYKLNEYGYKMDKGA